MCRTAAKNLLTRSRMHVATTVLHYGHGSGPRTSKGTVDKVKIVYAIV